MTAIDLEELGKHYGHTEALRGISLKIASGQSVALLGPSGCGKTTTLKCIAGLEDPTRGEIFIGGRRVAGTDLSVPPERRQVGMVFQSYALWPHMSVFANVAYPLEVRREPTAAIRTKVMESLETVGLGALAHRLPSELSGGQQQRVAVARCIVARPQVLLFDEPLSNLDMKLRAHMRFELKALLKQLAITAVYVTHDRNEAMSICDRVVLMNEGRIVQDGTPEELYARPVNLFAADFMGGGNFVEGEVALPGEPYGEVVANGLRVRCAIPAGISTGDRVTLVLRHELLRLTRDRPPEASNCWPVQVDERVYLGARAEYAVSQQKLRLRVEDVAAPWQPGEQGYLSSSPEHILCLRPEGKQAA